MGGGGGSAPKAPDYSVLAKQQADMQNQMLAQQTQANRPNQVNPYGSIQWSQDANGNWTQTQTMDGNLKANMDGMIGGIGQSLNQYLAQGAFRAPNQAQDFNPYSMSTGAYDPMTQFTPGSTGSQYADAFTESLMSRIRPQQEHESNQLATRLRLQGLQPGTEASDRATGNLQKAHGDVQAKAALDGMLAASGNQRADYATQLSYDQMGMSNNLNNQQAHLATQGQQYNQAAQTHQMPLQALQGLNGALTGSFQPQFAGFNQAGLGQAPDMMGAAQQSYAQKMQEYNEKAQKKEGKGSAIGSVVGGVAGSFLGPVGTMAGSQLGGAIGGSFSDETLKYNINDMSDEDCFNAMLKLVPAEWNWNGTNLPDSGVIAQRVEELFPSLTANAENGKMTVNYTGLFAILLGAFRHLAKGASDK